VPQIVPSRSGGWPGSSKRRRGRASPLSGTRASRAPGAIPRLVTVRSRS